METTEKATWPAPTTPPAETYERMTQYKYCGNPAIHAAHEWHTYQGGRLKWINKCVGGITAPTGPVTR